MKDIEKIDYGELRTAIKALNDSGLFDTKMKAIGVKENLVQEFTERYESTPEDAELPKEAVHFYQDIYADELGDEPEETEEDEIPAAVKAAAENKADAESYSPDPEDDPEADEFLDDEPMELEAEETEEIDMETVKFDKKQFLQIIKQIQPAVDDHVIFTPEDVVAYNGEICMKVPFFTDMRCVINVTDLYKTLNKMPKKNFQMSFDNDRNELMITTPGVRAGYISSPRINLIDSLEEVIDDADKIKWQTIPEDFLKGVDLVHFAASKKTNFGTATCLYVNGKELVATDRTRISHYEMQDDMGEFFVRADNIKHLKALNPTGFGLTDNWAHFRNDDHATVSFRLMHGEFPDYQHLLDYELKENIELTPKFQKMLVMAQTMSKNDRIQRINIKVDDKIRCRASNERGWVETDIPSKYKGKSFAFSIDPTFLLDAMKHGVTHMGLISSNALALEAENFKHLVALLAD